MTTKYEKFGIGVDRKKEPELYNYLEALRRDKHGLLSRVLKELIRAHLTQTPAAVEYSNRKLRVNRPTKANKQNSEPVILEHDNTPLPPVALAPASVVVHQPAATAVLATSKSARELKEAMERSFDNFGEDPDDNGLSGAGLDFAASLDQFGG